MTKAGLLVALAVTGAVFTPSFACAAELPLFVNAPAPATPVTPDLALQFGLKLRLPEGRGLARLLIDAGVEQDDAAAAARLAAGHLGAGTGGCQAAVSISRSIGGRGFRLVRVQLITDERQTVIERRGVELTVASSTPLRKALRLV